MTQTTQEYVKMEQRLREAEAERDEARAAAREIRRCYTDLSTACDPTTWKQRWPWLEDSDE